MVCEFARHKPAPCNLELLRFQTTNETCFPVFILNQYALSTIIRNWDLKISRQDVIVYLVSKLPEMWFISS